MNESKDNTYTLKAVTELVEALKKIFKKYSMSTRERSWEKLTSKEGDKEIKALIKNPSRNTNKTRTL